MGKIDDILKNYRAGSRDSLIPILQEVQAVYGYLSEDVIVEVGNFLGMSTTKIFGLATFYDQFRFIPDGKVHMRICNGTTCFINGSQSLISTIRETLGIEPGQTTRDGRFSYELTSCMGGCNSGPLISVGDSFYTHLKAEQIPELIRKFKTLADTL